MLLELPRQQFLYFKTYLPNLMDMKVQEVTYTAKISLAGLFSLSGTLKGNCINL